jgi:hypothetical protein
VTSLPVRGLCRYSRIAGLTDQRDARLGCGEEVVSLSGIDRFHGFGWIVHVLTSFEMPAERAGSARALRGSLLLSKSAGSKANGSTSSPRLRVWNEAVGVRLGMTLQSRSALSAVGDNQQRYRRSRSESNEHQIEHP